MIKISLKIIILLTLIASSSFNQSKAGSEGFTKGPVFKNHGENINVKDGLKKATQQHFKVVFDVYKENESDAPHRGFNSVARFINMHVRAGVPVENIEVALVVHGKASYDLMTNKAFKAKFSKTHASSDLLTQLLENNVRVFVCGQSSNYLGLTANQFTDGVEISLSAMTANALLQQEGYTLNPF